MDLRPDWFDIRVFQGSGLSSDPSTEVVRASEGKKANFLPVLGYGLALLAILKRQPRGKSRPRSACWHSTRFAESLNEPKLAPWRAEIVHPFKCLSRVPNEVQAMSEQMLGVLLERAAHFLRYETFYCNLFDECL